MDDFPVINNSYNFKCTMCGNCCSGDQTVLLNLYDLYKMARYERMNNTGQLFKKGRVELFAEGAIWRPKIRYKTKPLTFCPYLINQPQNDDGLKGLCSLHPDLKPLVCATSPIGRRVDLKAGSEEFVYAWPAPDCPGVHSKKSNLLDDLCRQYRHEMHWEDRFFILLQTLAHKALNRSRYISDLYSFDISENFENVLKKIEQKVARIE